MSHFSICKIKIRNPNIELLKQAVEQLAKELNGEIVTEIRDFAGNVRTDFLMAVKTPQLYRGVGIQVTERGEVKLVGDFWRVEYAAKVFEKNLVKTYTTLALSQTLSQMGYRLNVQKAKEKVMIYAEAY